MRIACHLIVGLILLGLETTVIPELPTGITFYNLLIPFVVYFSLFRRIGSGLTVVLLIGFAADVLSGAPNGIYMGTFLALWLLFRNIGSYFQAGPMLLFTLATAAGVGIENLVFFACLAISEMAALFSMNNLQLLVIQIFLVFLTAPFIYRLLAAYFNWLDPFAAAAGGKA